METGKPGPISNRERTKSAPLVHSAQFFNAGEIELFPVYRLKSGFRAAEAVESPEGGAAHGLGSPLPAGAAAAPAEVAVFFKPLVNEGAAAHDDAFGEVLDAP